MRSQKIKNIYASLNIAQYDAAFPLLWSSLGIGNISAQRALSRTHAKQGKSV